MLRKRALSLSVALLWLGWHLGGCSAGRPGAALGGRKLALDGIALFQQGKAEQASAKLEKAYVALAGAVGGAVVRARAREARPFGGGVRALRRSLALEGLQGRQGVSSRHSATRLVSSMA
jgi:hypothetical protein